MLADRLAHDAPQIRADAIGTALIDRVARLALGEDLLALRDQLIGTHHVHGLGHAHFGRAAALFFDAFNHIAHLLGVRAFRTVTVEIFVGQNRQAKADDARKEHPASGGVEKVAPTRFGVRRRV